VEIYTNGSLLDKNLSEKLLRAKVDRITFSINGTEKNYRKIMGLDYSKTKENVMHFLKQNKKMKHPVLCNISLMILKENEKDIKSFIEFWRKYADSVRVYLPSNWAGNLKSLDIINKMPFKNKRWTCPFLWNNVTVDAEGNVILCHRDCESKVVLGNLLKEDIKKIRNSENFKKIIEKHLNLDFSSPICSNCDNCADSSVEWWL